ncbi:MAG: nucleotidyltransferase domain-containing protein [Lautropia mirabilis]|jgi:DNA polymerase, beta domain protein region
MLPTARDLIVQHLRSHLPGLLAIYAFGSRITGHATPDSDLDLAVLVEGHADIIVLFNLSSDLADLAGCDVDLVDIRAASTVMQHQIIQTGVRWWAKDHQADLFEIYVCKEIPNERPFQYIRTTFQHQQSNLRPTHIRNTSGP